MDNINKKASGQNAIWDGPLDLDALPKGYGSSSGCKGMEISKAHCGCSSIKDLLLSELKRCNMTLGDFKLYSINTFALGITTFTKIEMGSKNITYY